MKIRVHALLKPTELQLISRKSGISGVLYLEVDGDHFPAKDWHDIVSHVMADWIQAALATAHTDGEVIHRFMDGSYEFGLRHERQSDAAAIRFYDRPGRLVAEHEIDFQRYLASLRGATKTLLQQAKTLGLEEHGEIADLGERLKQLTGFEQDYKARVHRSH